jgi:hypothetical protein
MGEGDGKRKHSLESEREGGGKVRADGELGEVAGCRRTRESPHEARQQASNGSLLAGANASRCIDLSSRRRLSVNSSTGCQCLLSLAKGVTFKSRAPTN